MEKTLLLIDAWVNLGLGLTLMLYPIGLIRALGLPEAAPTFYARVLGGVLFGIGLALFFEAYPTLVGSGGLALAGAIAINLSGAAILAVSLVFLNLELPIRGRVLLWSVCFLLVGLSMIELFSV